MALPAASRTPVTLPARTAEFVPSVARGRTLLPRAAARAGSGFNSRPRAARDGGAVALARPRRRPVPLTTVLPPGPSILMAARRSANSRAARGGAASRCRRQP